jgi:hypothetical protein
MSDLLVWNKPGVGPVLKVMADGADPFTTPNEEYGKFRFNSETADLGYLHFGPKFAFDPVTYANPGVNHSYNMYYWPEGTDASTCHVMIVAARLFDFSQNIQTMFYLWDRILGTDFPPIVETYSGGAKPLAGRAWQQTASPYGGPGGQIYSVGPYSDVAPVFHQQAGQYWPRLNPTNGWGIFPDLISAYTGYYSMLRMQSGSVEAGHRAWLLPANDAPLPFQTGTPLDDQHVVEFSPEMARMARPGFDVRTMTRFQAIFSETMSPAKIADTGLVTIAASDAITLTFDYDLEDGTYIDAIATRSGETYGYLPAMDAAMTNQASAPTAGMRWGVEYEIDGNEVTISNGTAVDVDVRYIVFADDGSEPTSGAGDALAWGDDYQQIRRPGASAEPSHADILLDTRWACLPIIADGWIAMADFGATPTADNEQWINGTHKASVTWDNDGSFVPFIKFSFVYHIGCVIGASATTIEAFAGARALEVSPNPLDGYAGFLQASVGVGDLEGRATPQTRRSAICRFTDSSADFYVSPGMSDLYHFNNGGGSSVRWRNQNGGGTLGTFGPVVGIRYYVFAIPKPEAA